MDISNLDNIFLNGRQIQNLYLDGKLIYSLEDGNGTLHYIKNENYVNPSLRNLENKENLNYGTTKI